MLSRFVSNALKYLFISNLNSSKLLSCCISLLSASPQYFSMLSCIFIRSPSSKPLVKRLYMIVLEWRDVSFLFVSINIYPFNCMDAFFLVKNGFIIRWNWSVKEFIYKSITSGRHMKRTACCVSCQVSFSWCRFSVVRKCVMSAPGRVGLGTRIASCL